MPLVLSASVKRDILSRTEEFCKQCNVFSFKQLAAFHDPLFAAIFADEFAQTEGLTSSEVKACWRSPCNGLTRQILDEASFLTATPKRDAIFPKRENGATKPYRREPLGETFDARPIAKVIRRDWNNRGKESDPVYVKSGDEKKLVVLYATGRSEFLTKQLMVTEIFEEFHIVAPKAGQQVQSPILKSPSDQWKAYALPKSLDEYAEEYVGDAEVVLGKKRTRIVTSPFEYWNGEHHIETRLHELDERLARMWRKEESIAYNIYTPFGGLASLP